MNNYLNYSLFIIHYLLFIALYALPCSAQSWREWSTVPVFDGGRTMPLSSFAQQIVEDICGTSKPFIVPDSSVLAELNRVIEERPKKEVPEVFDEEREEAFLPPVQSTLNGLAEGKFNTENQQISIPQGTSTLKITGLSRVQAERIIQRISTLFPSSGRYIDAPELLLSWFAEPEIWDYIPLFEAAENDYRTEVLDIENRNSARVPLRRVSVFQLEQSAGFQQRLDSLQQEGLSDTDEPLRYNKITRRIAAALSVYQNLVFNPQRYYPSRMSDLLNQAGGFSIRRQSSYNTAFGAWNYLMSIGDDPSITATAQIGDTGQMVHPVMERWHAVARKMTQLAAAFDRTDDKNNRIIPNLNAVERQFELLLKAVDANFEESAVLMEKIYPGVSFRQNKTENQSGAGAAEKLLPKLFTSFAVENPVHKETITQLILTYHYSVKQLRSEIEAAYLALYDNGRTLRVLPLIPGSFTSDSDLPQTNTPWASMQLVLYGGDSAIRHFLDPEFLSTDNTIQKTDAEKDGDKDRKTELKLPEIIPGILSTSVVEGITGGKRTADLSGESRIKQSDAEKSAGDNSAENKTGMESDNSQEEKTENSGGNTAKAEAETAAVQPAEKRYTERYTDERYEINLFDGSNFSAVSLTAASSLPPNRLDPVKKIRGNFSRLYDVYKIPGLEQTRTEFSEAGTALKTSLRSAAERTAGFQEKLLFNPADTAVQEPLQEYLKKAAYPSASSINSEYRYFSFSPFYWMWIFAAASAVSVLISLAAGMFRSGMIDAGGMTVLKQNKTRISVDRLDWDVRDKISWRDELLRPDLTNSPEEYFLWMGFILLGFSVFITFIGGVMRACISGWAPVTNMYETVVFLAFAASLLGIWYALYPVVKPLASLAWQFASLPSYGKFKKRFYRTSSSSDWNGISQISLSETSSYNSQKSTQFTDSKYAMRKPDGKRVGLGSGVFSGGERQVYGTRSGVFHPGGISVGNADNLVDSLADPLLEREKKLAKLILRWQFALLIPRFILMLLTFIAAVLLSYGEYAGQHGVWAAAREMLTVHDWIDWITVLFSIGVIVWFVPHIILSAAVFTVLLFRPDYAATDLGIISFAVPKSAPNKKAARSHSELSSIFQGETLAGKTGPEDNSGQLWFNLARNRILSRKLLVFVAAVIALAAGLAAYLNTAEFNPNIRPLMAVLRSNFWLTVHVVAIIVSYAAAFVAWGMSVLALGGAIFGRYRYIIKSDGTRRVQLPEFCDPFVPSILKLLRLSLILLVVGTILGARWADYSWGRFWSWDPKEVWALITVLFLAVILHGRIARYYGAIGIAAGALWSSIAVIITWYGINFVFKGSIHSYGGGSNTGAAVFLWTFIALNLLWAFIALFRYNTVSTFVQENDAVAAGK